MQKALCEITKINVLMLAQTEVCILYALEGLRYEHQKYTGVHIEMGSTRQSLSNSSRREETRRDEKS